MSAPYKRPVAGACRLVVIGVNHHRGGNQPVIRIINLLVGLIAAPAIVPIRRLMHLPRWPWFVPKPGQLYVEAGN